jgi:hypothetical protein
MHKNGIASAMDALPGGSTKRMMVPGIATTSADAMVPTIQAIALLHQST